MSNQKDFVLWLSRVDKNDAPYIGGKAANLGEMLKSKIPVPNGFVLNSFAYQTFIKENKLVLKIRDLLKSINYKNTTSLNIKAEEIKKIVQRSQLRTDFSTPGLTHLCHAELVSASC